MGHFCFAIVFKSDHLLSAIERCYLPQGQSNINQSDKRGTLTASLSPRLQCGHKRAFAGPIFDSSYCE